VIRRALSIAVLAAACIAPTLLLQSASSGTTTKQRPRALGRSTIVVSRPIPFILRAGPDGGVWFTGIKNNVVGRMSDSGDVTTFVDPTGSMRGPCCLVPGAADNFWFLTNDGIGRITTRGEITIFPGRGKQTRYLNWIALGPGNAAWFIGYHNWIGRMEADGSMRLFRDPHRQLDKIASITPGVDGSLWFTAHINRRPYDAAGRIDPNGNISLFPIASLIPPEIAYDPTLQPVAGPDGHFWFSTFKGIGNIDGTGTVTLFSGRQYRQRTGDLSALPDGSVVYQNSYGEVSRLRPDGTITEYKDPKLRNPRFFVAGQDSSIWLVDVDAKGVGHITNDGVVTMYSNAALQAPRGLIAGHDGDVWTVGTGDKRTLGRIAPDGTITVFALPAAFQ